MSTEDPSNVLVFAYGSNMCIERIRSRVASACPIATGFVRNRQLRFHKRSVDGSAKANAFYSIDVAHQVWGVVYQMTSVDKRELDEFEFLGVGYDETLVRVESGSDQFEAWMYEARPSEIDDSLNPYGWYHDYVTIGAYQHDLPLDYVREIRRVEILSDPDESRRAEHFQFLDSIRSSSD